MLSTKTCRCLGQDPACFGGMMRRRGRARARTAASWIAVAALVPLTLAAGAHAQVNIETLRNPGATPGFATSIDVRLQHRSGNVEHTKLDVDVRTDLRAERTHAFTLVRGGVGLVGGERFANEGLAHVRVMRGAGRVVPEAFTQADYDKSRKLDARLLGGAGVRVRLMSHDRRTVALGSAWMLEHERYDSSASANHEARSTVHRWSNYLVVRRNLGDQSSLSWITYAQPRFDAFDDLRVLVDASLGVGITATLALTTTFHLRYDSDPPDDIDDLDTALSTGVQIRF